MNGQLINEIRISPFYKTDQNQFLMIGLHLFH